MPTKKKVDEVELKTIELLISAVKEATHRSRAVFVIITVVCSMILFGLWNVMLSWERGIATRPLSDQDELARTEYNNDACKTEEEIKKERQGILAKIRENQKTATDEWIKNLYVSVGILGIRVSVHDLSVMGSFSLVVIMIWYYFVQRRENRAIASLFLYCMDEMKRKELTNGILKLAYEGVVQNIVFIDMGGGDKPISNLKNESSTPESNTFVRYVLALITFLPPFTIAMIVVSDMSSLFIGSYARVDFNSVWSTLRFPEHLVEVFKIIFYELFAIGCLVYTLYLCRKCRAFSKATSLIIRDFKQLLS